MLKQPPEHLAASIVEFCRFLRANGFSGDMRQTITALESARIINAADGQSFACALKTALCCNREEWERFSELFHRFWGESHPRPRSAAGEYKGRAQHDAQERQSGSSVFLDQLGKQSSLADGTGKAVYGASAQHRLKK